MHRQTMAATPAPAAVMAAGGVVSSTNNNDTTDEAPPWWQFHRRLSLPITAVTTNGGDGRGKKMEFDTIDWGSDMNDKSDENYEEENDDVIDDDDSLIDNKDPRRAESELLIDFGRRRNSSSVRKTNNCINDDDAAEVLEASTAAAVAAATGNDENNCINGNPDHADGHHQLLTPISSLQEELRNCEQASRNYIYFIKNTGDGGGNSSTNENPNHGILEAKSISLGTDEAGGTVVVDENNIVQPDKSLPQDVQPPRTSTTSPLIQQMNKEESDILDKSASFHSCDGLDESDDNDDHLINYSFDELDDTKRTATNKVDREQQQEVVSSVNQSINTREDEDLSRPAFRPSKSMEFHDSIWNLSSSELDYEVEAKEEYAKEQQINENLNGRVDSLVAAATGTCTGTTPTDVLDTTVSLMSKVDNLDDVSTIASSIHSGRVLRKKKIVPRRLSFVKSPPFGLVLGQRNNRPPLAGRGGNGGDDVPSERSINDDHDVDDDGFDDTRSRGESTTASIRSWQKRQQKQPKKRHSFVASLKTTMTWSTNNKTNGQSTSDELCNDEYDWDEDDDRYLEEEFFAANDARNEAIVKDACEIMNTVNKSAIAMGLDSPFLPVAETFPPFKKLHTTIGYQMEFLKAYIGNLQSTKRKSHQHRKSATKQRMISPSVCSDPSVIDDLQRLSGYLKEQISMVETCSQSHELLESSSYSSSCNPYLVHVCTSYLPNYLWYQPIAADATTIMRPTSLCSGTGITGKSQYLQPDMLRVFRMFGSYLVGSGHLFREEEEDEKKLNNKSMHLRRSAFWPDIPENDGENEDNDDESVSSSSVESEGSYRTSRLMQQNEFLEQIIEDLHSIKS